MTETPIPTLGQRYNGLVRALLTEHEGELCVDPTINRPTLIYNFAADKSPHQGVIALALLEIAHNPIVYMAIITAVSDMPGHIQQMIGLAGFYFDDCAPSAAAEKLRDAADAMQVIADQRAKTEGLPPAVHGANNAGVV